ncbi:MAG: dTDP-4-dehydrorhamnose 3,5-epimerase family protein, partial [Vibrio sp.]
EGFAHGFFTISETAEFLYKTTNYYHPQSDRSILWNDENLSINWPSEKTILSKKDEMAVMFSDAEYFL